MKLPNVKCDKEFEQLDRNDPLYQEVVKEICKRHQLPSDSLQLYSTGSCLVFEVNQTLVVKLFAPFDGDYQENEAFFLRQLQGKFPAPDLIDRGEFQGWPYLILSKISGRPLDLTWALSTPNEKQQLIKATARMLRQLHRLECDPPPAVTLNWTEFLSSRKSSCVAFQQKKGLESRWLDQIPDFIKKHEPANYPCKTVILHTEVMPAHLFINSGDYSSITGLIDYEPSMPGPAEYDFISVGLFLTQGIPGLFPKFLDEYGYQDPALRKGLCYRLMALTLLHRYSNLKWYLDFLPDADDLESLAEIWFESTQY